MRVRVVVPTYNRAEYLKEAINSILEQTYRDFELVVLDNCSTDSTQNVVDSYDDSRIKYIRHKENIGGIENINYALSMNDVEFLVVFHDDDVMCENFLDNEVAFFDSHSEATIISGNAIVLNGEIENKAKTKYTEAIKYRGTDFFDNFINNHETLVFPSVMYRGAFLKAHNIYLRKEVGPCADVVLCMDIAQKGGIIYEIPQVVMKYRIHEGQDSQINLYPMNIKLFHYLRCNDEYNEQFVKNVLGRKNKFGHLCKMICIDYISEKISKTDADVFINQLKKELACKNKNVWMILYSAARRNKLARCIEKRLYYFIKSKNF